MRFSRYWLVTLTALFMLSGALSVHAQTVTLPKGVTGYQVNLSWDAPTSSPDPVAGYNAYRSPSGVASYQQLNATELPLTPTTYSDVTVVGGNSYDYIVESVDASGVTSAPSNVATVSIPTTYVPNPPVIGILSAT